MTRAIVTTSTRMDLVRLGADRRPVRVSLIWRTADAYCVQLVVHGEGAGAADEVRVLSRELLAEGLTHEAGLGDVALRPDPHDPADAVLFVLRSPTGQTRLRCDTWVLADFLDTTYQHVPLGDEPRWVSFAAEITALLDVTGG
jgi:hypothetical protein